MKTLYGLAIIVTSLGICLWLWDLNPESLPYWKYLIGYLVIHNGSVYSHKLFNHNHHTTMSELKYKACTRVTFRIAGEELEGTIDSALSGRGDVPAEYYIETDDGVMYHVTEADIVRAEPVTA